MRVLVNTERFSQRWAQQIEQFTVRYTFIDSYVLCCSYLLKSSSTKSTEIMQSMNVQMLAFEAHHLLTPVPAMVLPHRIHWIQRLNHCA